MLDSTYLIIETIEIASLTATGTLKSGIAGEVTAEDLDPIAKAGAKVSYEGGSTYTITFDQPMLIGYKAARIPETILGTAVSATGQAETDYVTVQASTLNQLKE